MITRLSGMGLIALLSAAAIAQTEKPAASSDKPKSAEAGQYWVRVVGERVNIRSRPDRNSAIVTRTEKGQVLRVVGTEYGWCRVEPPRDVFSLVSAAHVDLGPDKRGVVAVERGKLRVRVGSAVRKLDPSRSEVQTLLPRGAVVQVRENLGEWLKIDPPAGVFVYVSADFTERISESDALQWLRDQEAVMNADLAPKPAANSAADADGVKHAADQRPPSIDLSGRWGVQLASVEGRVEAEAKRPIVDQGWGGVISELGPIASQRSEPEVARLASAWIVRLQERVFDQDLVRQAGAISRRQARAREQHERELAGIQQARKQSAKSPDFVARGELATSFAFDRKTHPRRYRLLDPLSRRIEAYVDFPAGYAGDPKTLVGKLIGVRGKRRQVAGLGVDVIDVAGIVALEPIQPATRKTP